MHIFTAHAQKWLLKSFRSKMWPHHSLWRPRFHIRQMHSHYRVTFTGYIRCFCGTTSHNLVTLTFDLLTLRVFHVHFCNARPTYQFSLSYDYRLLSYELLNLITFALKCTVITHAPCYVHISEIPDPNLPIHFVTFRALRRRLSHVICENSIYSIV